MLNTKIIIKTLLMAVALSTLLLGCGNEAQEDPQLVQQRAKALMPADAELKDIYLRSCVACHVSAETSAPLVGDSHAWNPRLAKGMDSLLDSVINGYGGMPPFGMCMDCNLQQFEDLIHFMSQAK